MSLHRVGFKVEFTDGSVMDELHNTWDDVSPDKIVQAVTCIKYPDDGTGLFKMVGADRYYFSNEAVSNGSETVLTGKIFGMISGDKAVEVHVRHDGLDYRVLKREMPASDVTFVDTVYRRGK